MTKKGPSNQTKKTGGPKKDLPRKRESKKNNQNQTKMEPQASTFERSRGKKKLKNDREDTKAQDILQTVDGSEKRKKKLESSSNSKNAKKKTSKSKKRTKMEEMTCEEPDREKEKEKKGHKVRHMPTTSAQIENYQQFIRETCNIGVQGIVKQFDVFLKGYVPPGVTSKAFQNNMDKNRYKDVICLDATRIVLKGGKNDNDYIHANNVDGDPLSNKFICTQGPLHNTTHDFWRMIVQEKCQLIFMLCQTMEMDKEKCHQYWPKEKGSSMTFKEITIKNVEVDKVSDATSIISTLQIGCKDKEFTVKHYHWQSWPDKSVPTSILAPFRLLKVSRASKSPTVVHCSAGVGRTGAMVGIEIALQHILLAKPMSLTQVVQELRMKRMHCVQTDLQLLYMYRCLIAYAEITSVFKNNEELESKCKIFIKDYENLVNERLAAIQGPGVPKALSPVYPMAQSPVGPPGATKMPSPVQSPIAQSPRKSPNPFKAPDPPKDGDMPQKSFYC